MIIISVYKIAQLNFFVKSFFRISGKFFRICSPNRILQLPKRKQGVGTSSRALGESRSGSSSRWSSSFRRSAAPKRQAITKADLMALGLSGGPGAAERRKELPW